MSGPDLSVLPGLATDGEDPTFAEPWEAQAFALTLALHEAGRFTWTEWADHLSAQVHGGEDRPYYRHWLAALEKLMAEKAHVQADQLEARQRAWLDAAARTPHGEPIELAAAVRAGDETISV